jgi:scyllo-inositol 2-dehydrogenase (NADP+)
MNSKIKIGLAGFGNAARIMHAPFLATLDEYEVVSVLERNKEESKKYFPQTEVVRTLDELLNTNVEIILITTPNETHFDYATKSLRAGKNVVLEKPFTITSEEALELIKIAKQENKILSVFQNRRYDSDFLTVKEILEKNLLGDLHTYEAHFDRYRPEPKPGKAWREEDIPGSGITYDLGSHLIDQALRLFGLPKNIYAEIKKQRSFAKVDDYFEINLDYGFLKVILKSGMLVREQGPKFLIHGTKGSFIKYGEDPQEEKLKAGILPTAKDWGKEDEKIYGLLHAEMNGEIIYKKYESLKGNYGLFYKNLYNAIIHHAPLNEKPEHGYDTIKLIELAFESNKQKRMLNCDELLLGAF